MVATNIIFQNCLTFFDEKNTSLANEKRKTNCCNQKTIKF